LAPVTPDDAVASATAAALLVRPVCSTHSTRSLDVEIVGSTSRNASSPRVYGVTSPSRSGVTNEPPPGSALVTSAFVAQEARLAS
jgi:hypothetical protein